MNRCIYLKGTEPQLTFTSEEHIIPAGIGGITKLDRGMVSDQCNNKFSAMELNFMRHSVIAIPRQLEGPGKRGSLSNKKATESFIHIMTDSENKSSLGYIKNGQPYQIPQMIFLNENQVEILFNKSSDDYKKNLIDF